MGAWLATTARRECLRVLRASARVSAHGDELPDPADDAPGHDASLLARERDGTLHTAFARLPERDRSLLRMLMANPAPATRRSAQRSGCPSEASAPPERAPSRG